MSFYILYSFVEKPVFVTSFKRNILFGIINYIANEKRALDALRWVIKLDVLGLRACNIFCISKSMIKLNLKIFVVIFILFQWIHLKILTLKILILTNFWPAEITICTFKILK